MLSGKYLAADGIENCINVLDEIENGTIKDLDFVEFNACNGGCVGGTLNGENPYIAKARLRSLRKYLPISRNRVDGNDVPLEVLADTDFFEDVEGLSVQNRMDAIKRMTQVQEIYKSLPHLDCGSCGAPNCHALAEDIIAGEASIEDSLIKLRENFHKND